MINSCSFRFSSIHRLNRRFFYFIFCHHRYTQDMQLTKSLLHTTDAYMARLREAGIETVTDLLTYFPRDIEDKSDVCEQFSSLNIIDKQVVKCRIELITSENTRNKKLLIKAVLVDRDGSYAEAVWFNRKYLLQQYTSGDTVLIYGKPKYEYGRLTFPSAEIEHLKMVRREIVPVYSDLNYIPGIWIREKIVLLRSYLSGNFADTVPVEIRLKHSFRTRAENISSIHFPTSIEDFDRSKTELGYEELYHFQRKGLEKKYALERDSLGLAPELQIDVEIMKSLIASLPFPLTNKQRIVLFQILKDMERPHAMARMLQGDVGTGKTVVALLASVHAILVSRNKNPD
jgi:ATP-dependent DNA helicase RecG